MDSLTFPENTSSRVIISSNKKGTGFLRNAYDPRFLVGIIKE